MVSKEVSNGDGGYSNIYVAPSSNFCGAGH